MAHPKREPWIPGLVAAIDADVQVVWDQKQDRWDTGRRSLLAYNPQATHHLVVQDDAIVCRELVAGLTKAIQVSEDRPVCLYSGAVRPRHHQVRMAVENARQAGSAWLEMEGPWWGVGILLPTCDIEAVVAYGDRKVNVANYDMKIARYYRSVRTPCWYTAPSLVDHRHGDENPSLVPGRSGANRKAHWFAGSDMSALDVDWHTEPIRKAPAMTPKAPSGPSVTYRHVTTGKVLKSTSGTVAERRLAANPYWEQVDPAPMATGDSVPSTTQVELQTGERILSRREVADPPPRSGRGSGKQAWADYARDVTGRDGFDGMSRDDIIRRLDADGHLQ
jgi:hypothetical protein